MSVFSIEEVSAQEIRLTIDGSLSGEPFEDLQKNLDRVLEKLHPLVTLDLTSISKNTGWLGSTVRKINRFPHPGTGSSQRWPVDPLGPGRTPL